MGTKINTRVPTTTSLPETRPLFGRDDELQHALTKLNDGVRLLSILGPPGVGKSHLAAELAHRCIDHDVYDHIHWIDCSCASTPQELVACFFAALTAAEDRPHEDPAALIPLLRKHGQSLWVLNNCEQAAASTADSLPIWLSEAAEACFLVTSRKRLELREEHCLELTPLEPEMALELLLDRARRIAPDWAQSKAHQSAAEKIVDHLDCLPLALELAAGRARLLNPPELYERLTANLTPLRSNRPDLPPRHRTLYSAIDWSWSLLDDDEKDVLARPSSFEEGFDLHHLEDVLHHRSDIDVLHTVAGLRDHSLLLFDVTHSARPYRVLSIIADFVHRQSTHFDQPVSRMTPGKLTSNTAQVAEDGSWLKLPGEPRINIERPLLQKLLQAVAQQRIDRPGSALAADALIKAGWPNESILPRAARNRLYAAIHALRSQGLGELLLTRNDGYLLDLRVPLVWAEVKVDSPQSGPDGSPSDQR